MSLQAPEVPTAPAEQVSAPAAPRSSREGDHGRPADERTVLSGAALRAEFAATRRARRESVQPQKPTGAPPVNPEPAAKPGQSPAPEQSAETTNATSASADGEQDTVELVLGGDGEAPAGDEPGGEKAEQGLGEEILDDPAALEALDEEQIRKLPNAEVRRLIRRNQRLAARATKAEARLQEATRQAAVTSRDDGPVQSGIEAHPEVRQIDQRVGHVSRLLEWLDANPEGGEYADESGKVLAAVSPEQVRRSLRAGERELARLESQRESKLQHLKHRDGEVRKEAFTKAQAAYPWLAKPESDEYALAAQVLQGAPYLRQHPEWPLWLADAVEGRRARMARESAPKPAASRPVPPRVPPPGGAAPAKVDPVLGQLAEAEAAFEKSGSMRDLKRVEILKRQIKSRSKTA